MRADNNGSARYQGQHIGEKLAGHFYTVCFASKTSVEPPLRWQASTLVDNAAKKRFGTLKVVITVAT